MRVVVYNPLSLVQPFRLHEISSRLSHIDIVCPGTRLRSKLEQEQTVIRMKNHDVYSWGYGRGPNTNRSTGVTFLKKGLFRDKHVVNIQSPPREMQGRAGAMRLKSGRYDILIVGAYLPPFAGNTKDFPRHKQTVDKVMSWCQGQIQQAPYRCTPIVCLDLNDKLGYIKRKVRCSSEQGLM